MKRSIYRRRRNGRKERRYTIAYELPDGRIRTERAYTDKQASEQLLAQREREVARLEVGLVDVYDDSRRRPIGEHLQDYLRNMESKGRTAAYVARTRSRLLAAFEGVPVRTLVDLTIDAIARYIDSKVTGERLSLSTRNHLVAALRAFGGWLADHDRLPGNPLRKLQVIPVTDGDRTTTKRVLTVAELIRLADAAPPARRLLYLFSAFTGFRRGEDRATTWADLQLDGEHPAVRIQGRDAKSGATVDVPIPGWLAAELRRHRAAATMRAGGHLQLTAPVFRVPSAIVRQLRQDAAKAGLGSIRKQLHTTPAGNAWASVEWIDPAGPNVTLVLHGLRAVYATMLFEANTPLHEVQRLCRHASITTTIKHYTAWRQSRLRDAVDRLPDPTVTVPVTVAGIPSQSAPVRSGPDASTAQGGQAVAQ